MNTVFSSHNSIQLTPHPYKFLAIIVCTVMISPRRGPLFSSNANATKEEYMDLSHSGHLLGIKQSIALQMWP